MSAFAALLQCLLMLVVGALIPVLAASNAALSRSVGGIAWPSVILFALALLTALVFTMVTRAPLPPASAFANAPRYGYIGGLIVASYVLSITYFGPKIGVGTAIMFVVAGQILSAALIDHFGLLNAAISQFTPRRLTGVAFMLIGVFLARKI